MKIGLRKRKRPSGAGSEARKVAHHVMKNPLLTLGEISAKTGVSEEWLRVSFNRTTGKTFTQFQRDARLSFIEKNKGMTNTQLCQNLRITKSTLSYLIKDLKKTGRIPVVARVKVGRSKGIPFEYKPMALEVLRAINWYPSPGGLSVPDVVEITGRAKNQVNSVIKSLVKQGYLKRGKKVGQRQYYVSVSEGLRLAQQLERMRVRKDRELEKDKRAIPGMIKRKEAEKERVLNVLMKATREELVVKRDVFSPRVRQLNEEIKRLQKLRA